MYISQSDSVGQLICIAGGYFFDIILLGFLGHILWVYLSFHFGTVFVGLLQVW